MHPLLAAGAIDLAGVTTIIQGLSDGLFKLGTPLAVVGIIIGGLATWMGYQHGPHTLRNSIIALVIVGLARIVAAAVFAAG
jgi:hypothetical protein